MVHVKKKNPSERSSRYKTKNLMAVLAAIVMLIVFTYVQSLIYQLKGSVLLFHALVNLNLILLLVVVIVLIRYLIKIYFEREGSRFSRKLVLAFLISTLLPSLFLFLISTNFIRETLDRWLNPIGGDPLEDAMAVVRILHNHYKDRSLWFGHQLSKQIFEQDLLSPEKKDELTAFIQKKQREYNLGVLQVFDTKEVELTRSINENIPIGKSVTTPSNNLSSALKGDVTPPIILTAGGGTLYRSFIPLKDKNDIVQGALVLNFFSTERLLPKLTRITQASETYQQQQRMKQPIKQEYIYLFLFPTLLIMFFAIWFGFYLARGVTQPIQKLAEGTRSITAGNLDFEFDVQAFDEIGLLVSSFEIMRRELKKNRNVLEQQHRELEVMNRELDKKQHYMTSLLESLTTGVIAMDRQGVIITINAASQGMLQIEPQFMLGKNYQDVFNRDVLYQFKIIIDHYFETSIPKLNEQINFYSNRMTLHLSTSVIVMKEPQGELLGVALVLEDLTELIKSQKAAAWSEVARRIAHEIKNPLTPIRLSAQRISRKLKKDALSEPLFEDCCLTIIREVDTIQRLVNSFSRFAKMPEAKPEPAQLNDFIESILEGFTTIHPRIALKKTFLETLPLVSIDKDLMKQALTNILDNAVEAIPAKGTIELKTTYDSFLSIVRLQIIDDGMGIKAEDKERLFMPYFSTKKRGTGLGLAIVARIIGDHYGYVRVADNHPRGTRFIIELPSITRTYSGQSTTNIEEKNRLLSSIQD